MNEVMTTFFNLDFNSSSIKFSFIGQKHASYTRLFTTVLWFTSFRSSTINVLNSYSNI